jgi:hypothetical protein
LMHTEEVSTRSKSSEILGRTSIAARVSMFIPNVSPGIDAMGSN